MKRKLVSKKFKKKHLSLILFAIVIIAVTFYKIDANKKDKESFNRILNSSYTGIINDIRYSENNHGSPEVYINGNWVLLSNPDISTPENIDIGDSISKNAGTMQILVFRKNLEGEWIHNYKFKSL